MRTSAQEQQSSDRQTGAESPPPTGGSAATVAADQSPVLLYGREPLEAAILEQRLLATQGHGSSYARGNQYGTHLDRERTHGRGRTAKDELIDLLRLPTSHPLRSKKPLAAIISEHLEGGIYTAEHFVCTSAANISHLHST